MTQPTKAAINATLSKLQSVSQEQVDALWDKNVTKAGFLGKIPGLISYLSEKASAYIAARQFNKSVEALFVAIDNRPLKTEEVNGLQVKALDTKGQRAIEAAEKAMKTFFHAFSRRCEQISSTDIALNDKAVVKALSSLAKKERKGDVKTKVRSQSFAKELNTARFNHIVAPYAKLALTSITPENFDKKVAELVSVFNANESDAEALRQDLCQALNKKRPGEFAIEAAKYLATSDNKIVAQLIEEMTKGNADKLAKLEEQMTELAGPNKNDGSVAKAWTARAAAEAAFAGAKAAAQAQGGRFSDDAQFDAILDDENSTTTVSEETQKARKARAEFRKADEAYKALDKQLNEVVYPAHWELSPHNPDRKDVAAEANRIVSAQGQLYLEISQA
jgi:hypothetical protein